MPSDLRKIVLHTGNIIEMEEQIRLVGQSTTQELKACVKTALNQWTSTSPEEGVLVVKGQKEPLLYSASRGISTTTKIFLSDNSGANVTDAIKTELKNVDSMHSVIVAPPDVSDDFTLEELMDMWTAMERAVDEGDVRNIGIADISDTLFKELYEWARVKPSTLQVNLANCCNVSDEMTEFARTHDVQMLTHSDTHDILDEEVVSSILSRVGVPGTDFQVLWLARHRTIHTSFGLILDKGYTIAIACGEAID